MKEKSPKNKTIDFTVEEGQNYLNNILHEEKLSLIKDITQVQNKSVLGDSISFMQKLPDNSIDLIIADPPYNMYKDFHGNAFKEGDFRSYKIYTETWLNECIRILKDTGSIYICCDWKSGLVIGNIVEEKLLLKNRITWEREKGRGAKTNWKNSMEDIFFATKTEKYTFNLDAVKVMKKVIAPYKVDGKPKDWVETENGKFRLTCPSNFWNDISVPYWSMPENTAHPTQKPEKLLAKLILASSNENDLVFDPFLGSGSTSVTAKKLNRRYLGVEQNLRYILWAEERLNRAETDKSIQGFNDGVFTERNFTQTKK